ncbi:dimethylsulfonioproprionate lyase DddP [Rhodovibrionaceae bacterium A322]
MLQDNPFSISSSNRKIDPTRRRATPATRPDGSPADNDRVEIGPTQLAFDEWEALGQEVPNLEELRAYRLGRMRAEIQKHDLAGLLLFDPLNIRYATDCTNMQLWIAHNPCRACFIPAEGPLVLWDFHGCDHLSAHLPLVNEIRHGAAFFYFEAGDRMEEFAERFAREVDALMREHCGGNRRLAVDKMEIPGVRAFDNLGVQVLPGQGITEHARAIKNDNEMKAMRCAIKASEAAVAEMEAALRPGMTENALWAVLHHGNIIRGGEWIETRLLSSGPRTNPWYQECGPRVIQDGDIVAFDTDLIGPYGYCSDFSRTWLCGEGDPTAEQIELYKIAHEHITTNAELLKPGVSFQELTEKALRLPSAYRDQRYGVCYHGVGLCDEYPSIRYPEDFDSSGYDGQLQAGMVLCVEAYVGAVGGREGVKLEDQVLITEQGFENLVTYPFDKRLLGG